MLHWQSHAQLKTASGSFKVMGSLVAEGELEARHYQCYQQGLLVHVVCCGAFRVTFYLWALKTGRRQLATSVHVARLLLFSQPTPSASACEA